jgi:hypothetical protein
MKTQFILLLMSFVFINWTTGQNAGSIKGRVLDAKTKEPMPMANVYLDAGGSNMGATTDMDGRFSIKPLSGGTYQVNFSYVGYATKTVGVTVFPGEITFMKDILISDGILLGGDEGVIVGAEKENARLIDPGQIGKIPMKSGEISKIAGSDNIAMALRAVSSEIQIGDNGKDIVFRGSRSGSSSCYIDGVKQNDVSSTIPGCAVGSIIVYSGGIPAQYGDVTGGIIVLETKGYFDVRAEKRIEASKKKDMKTTKEE